MVRKVLVTGAAGRIGRAFRQYLDEHVGDRYELRLVDRSPLRVESKRGDEVIGANLSELEVCQSLCRGVDTVLHLAADASTQAGFYESLLDNNVKSVYNIFRAAKDQGCRRVIFTSSIQVIEGYPLDVQ